MFKFAKSSVHTKPWGLMYYKTWNLHSDLQLWKPGIYPIYLSKLWFNMGCTPRKLLTAPQNKKCEVNLTLCMVCQLFFPIYNLVSSTTKHPDIYTNTLKVHFYYQLMKSQCAIWNPAQWFCLLPVNAVRNMSDIAILILISTFFSTEMPK